eukprot:Nk52_evm19s2367 gene=Nk52_evmTU19s2367
MGCFCGVPYRDGDFAPSLEKRGQRIVIPYNTKECCCRGIKPRVALPNELRDKGVTPEQWDDWVNVRLLQNIEVQWPSVCCDTVMNFLTCFFWVGCNRCRGCPSLRYCCTCQCCCPSSMCDPLPALDNIKQWQKEFNALVLNPLGLHVKTLSTVYFDGFGRSRSRLDESAIVFSLTREESAIISKQPHVTGPASGGLGGCCNPGDFEDVIAY